MEEIGDKRLFGPDITQKTTETTRIIKKKMRATQSRQKAYADQCRRPLEFSVGDKIFLKVSPMKRMVCMGKKTKSIRGTI